MKSISIILLVILTSVSNSDINEIELLDSLRNEEEITEKEYEIFKNQVDYKIRIGTNIRRDSLDHWNLDVVYTEETYFHKKDSFLVREYYFNLSRLDSFKREKKIYKPDRYYENGVLTKRYFFKDAKGKEHLESILDHMKNRKVVTSIDPLAKIEVIHAGCGMSWKSMKYTNEKAENDYKKAKMPNYFLIESLIENGVRKVSFQRPLKQKFKVIVEGHPF
jgi:hypothetical protein